MAKGSCKKDGCMIADTSICLLSHPSPETQCPHFTPENRAAIRADVLGGTQIPTQKDIARRFHVGLELGTEDAMQIMRARYGHLIGIVGAWDAGKTCFL